MADLELVLSSRYGSDCRVRVQPALEDWYKSTASIMWEAITTLTPSSCAPPRVEIVHSPQSLPQLLAIGKDSFLVYDQHLGQIVARLTRLEVGRASPAAVDAYLAKLAGVRLLACGRWRSASVLTIASRLFEEQDTGARTEEGEAEPATRYALTQGQEAFVLGHELAHHLKFSDGRAFGSFDEDVVTLMEHWRDRRQKSPHNREYVVNELTRSAVVAWERRFGPLEQARIDQIRQSFAADSSEVGVARDARDTFAAFMDDSDLHEEATCDVLASVTAVPALVRGGASPSEAVEACAYAMHHLRLIQTVNSVADGVAAEDLARGVSTSMNRVTILRACLGVFLETVFGKEFMSASRCHEVITQVNLLHSEVIGDQLWLMTSRTLRDLLAMESAHDPNPDAVREALGFGPSRAARRMR